MGVPRSNPKRRLTGWSRRRLPQSGEGPRPRKRPARYRRMRSGTNRLMNSRSMPDPSVCPAIASEPLPDQLQQLRQSLAVRVLAQGALVPGAGDALPLGGMRQITSDLLHAFLARAIAGHLPVRL